MLKRPGELVSEAPMKWPQILVVAMCTLLNALDGFDVLSISFAAPGIAEDWGINRAALGVVLSAELVGMAIGSIIIGWIADLVGRRPTVLLCLIVMSSGMLFASIAADVNTMLGARLYTGVGIGGMLAVTNAFVAEYSNHKVRSFAVTVMAAGFPVGAIVGGTISAELLARYEWNAVFVFGAVVTAACIPLVLLALPESVAYLERRRPARALEKINRNLRRMGIDPLTALPNPLAEKPRSGIVPLFSPRLIDRTVLLSLAYFCHIMTFYYILKWIPKIVVDMGYPASEAASALVWANVGGLSGALMIGYLSKRVSIIKLLVAGLVLASVLVASFGRGYETLAQLSLAAALAGFFTNGCVSGYFAVLASAFPPEVRAGGTGFVIGVGRGGSALGPVIAGVLFTVGLGLQGVSIAMGLGSFLSALFLATLALRASKSGNPILLKE